MQKDDSNMQISNFYLPKKDELNKIMLFILNNDLSSSQRQKQLNQLQSFVNLVLKENKHHNIIGKNTQQTIWTRHILDSLQLTNFVKDRNNNNENYDIIDFGSGAGFPAIPLSIVLKNQILCIEKSPVKAKFLQNVKDKLNLKNTTIFNTAIDENNINTIINKNTIVISRAFKSIDKIFQLLGQPIEENKIKKIVLLKGQKWQEEIDNTPAHLLKQWKLKNYSSTTGQGVILVFEKL